MELNINILMGNAAFENAPMSELARILREYAENIERTEEPNATLRDINGNRVGFARLFD